MELKQLSLCDHVFKDFMKQIKEGQLYLIKLDDRWFVSEIRHVISRGGGRDDPHCWDVDAGWVSHQLSHRSLTHIDAGWQEIWELKDPELIKKKTKAALREKAEVDEDQVNML